MTSKWASNHTHCVHNFTSPPDNCHKYQNKALIKYHKLSALYELRGCGYEIRILYNM